MRARCAAAETHARRLLTHADAPWFASALASAILQMVFPLYGPLATALVSVRATKAISGRYRYLSLAFDIVETGQRIVMEGDPSDVILATGDESQ